MAIYSKLLEGLNNGDEMFVKVFTVNPKGRVNNRIDLPWASAVPAEMPDYPSTFELIDSYETAQTWTAPENGWYQIELYGASGNGGAAGCANGTFSTAHSYPVAATGGGGGSGAYAMSIVALKKGDTITLESIEVGNTAILTVESSYDASYSHTMKCVSGGNGYGGAASVNISTKAQTASVGAAGAAGTASGGLTTNINGKAGNKANSSTGIIKDSADTTSSLPSYTTKITSAATGGGASVTGGRVGGAGGRAQIKYDYWSNISRYVLAATAYTTQGSGQAAYMKIYRGNTNVA